MRARAGNDESGMTLIELLISMAIMLVIMAPLVTSFALSLATTTRADQDTTNSADSQLLTTYFHNDVGNADSVGISSSCGDPASILQLKWLDGDTYHYVVYAAALDPAPEGELSHQGSVYTLTRNEWIQSTPCAGATAPLRSSTLVRSASSIPVPLCDGTACTNASTTPRTVTMPIDELGRRTDELHYQFTLEGTRRVIP